MGVECVFQWQLFYLPADSRQTHRDFCPSPAGSEDVSLVVITVAVNCSQLPVKSRLMNVLCLSSQA